MSESTAGVPLATDTVPAQIARRPDVSGTSLREIARRGPWPNPLLVASVLLVGAVTAIRTSAFLSHQNLVDVLAQSAVPGMLVVGMVALMISGGIDLSVGSVVSLTGVIAAKLFVHAHASEPVAILAAIGAGLGCGLLNGFVIAYSGAMPFIVTLGSLSIFGGLALEISSNTPVVILSGFQGLGVNSALGLPVDVWITLLAAVIVGLVLHATRWGRLAFAVGGNERAAYLSGISLPKTKIALYALSGALAGLAGAALASRIGSGSPTSGAGLELEIVAAAVIGGASLAGGRGSLIGGLLGVLLLQEVTDSLTLQGIPSAWGSIVFGLVIVVAVGGTRLRRRPRPQGL
jgi:ribose transport system permease protein